MPAQRPFSRRHFIQGAAAAAGVAAVGFPMIGPSAARGDDQPAGAGERINLGFIGVGKQAWGHADFFSGRKEVQVVAICDVNATRREAAAAMVKEKYEKLARKGGDDIKTYGDFRELLGRKDIDAVVIGTPDHWHAALVIEAAKVKKDIYCEKPLTLTIHEAKTAIDAVRKYDRVFQTGSQQRSQGPFREACEIIRNGKLGKIREILVGVGVTSKPCDLPGEQVDPATHWDLWLGQAPERPYNEILCRKGLHDSYPFNPGWRDYREFSGGYITDWGAHHFDIIQWALDMDKSGPVEVMPPEKAGDAYGARYVYRGSPVGDNITVTHVETIFEHDGKDNEGKAKHFKETNGILFIGEKGKLFVNRERLIAEPELANTERESADRVQLYKSPGHRENWMECIKSRQRPVCDVEIGARSVTVCHLVNLAYWHGKKLRWDPQAWEFPGDAEANGWRERPRRKGYELPTV